jgi:hypothetical protein
MVELEAKAESLEAALASPAPPLVELPDNLAALYRERIAEGISPARAALKASRFAVLSGVFWRTTSYERTYDGIGIEG